MSKPIINKSNFTQSRRNFLKGAAYTSALSVGGLSSLAYAVSDDTSVNASVNATGNVSGLANADISVMQQQMLHKETVSLFNNSDEGMMLDAKNPVKIERVNGSLLVRPNVVDAVAVNGMIMMMPRERISFDIQTTGGTFSSAEITDISKLDGQLMHITSEHSAFNRLIPVTNPNITEAKPIMAAV